MNDPVLFYLRQVGFVAYGEIANQPRNVEPRWYTAEVHAVKPLASVVPLEFTKEHLSFGWLNQRIKRYTTINGTTETRLDDLLSGYRAPFAAAPLAEGTPRTASVTVYDRDPEARR